MSTRRWRNNDMTATFDTVVIGGGVVGMSVAYGLSRAGERVCVLDEGDDAYRAARGNFGLVWVQGKGSAKDPSKAAGNADYARWTLASAARWPAFAAELADRTGVDVELSQIGGLTFYLKDSELQAKARSLQALRSDLGGHYPYDVLNVADIRKLVPQVGDAVAGAIYGPLDGHVSPLKLLRALFHAFHALGGVMRAGAKVERLRPQPQGGFVIDVQGHAVSAAKVVLAAGLGNRQLAAMVGVNAPVVPVRGQLMVSERTVPFLRYPTGHVRQTGEGVLQIGYSHEEAGYDDATTVPAMGQIAANAIRCFPLLEGVNIVRAWGALRVMSPDGYPIYQQSPSCPGAFVVSCHSGITLASQHADVISAWVRGQAPEARIDVFSGDRFSARQQRAA